MTDKELILELFEIASDGLERALNDVHQSEDAGVDTNRAQGKKDAYRVVLSIIRSNVEDLPMPRDLKELGAGCPFCDVGHIETKGTIDDAFYPCRLTAPSF